MLWGSDIPGSGAKFRLPLLVVILGVGLCADTGRTSAAEDARPVSERYTKYEYHIPMRDGQRLFTAVYVPRESADRHPILLTRTPYGVKPYGVDQYRSSVGPSPLFADSGYIFVYQDVRGRWMSEGDFVNMRPPLTGRRGPDDVDENTDTWDTIDWLVTHLPGHNGKVGMTGVSYPGFYTSVGMIDAHPALVACSPQAPILDWFVGDDWHHNGALQLAHTFNFMSSFGRPRPEPTKRFEFSFSHGTPDGYEFFLKLGPLTNVDARYFKGDVPFWNEIAAHPDYDEFWKARNLRPHLKQIRPAVMTVGGWFDAENLFGALQNYRQIESQSPGTVNTLVMGPWSHGGWSRGDGALLGDVSFGMKTAVFYREQIEFPFFEFHLKGRGKATHPEAWVFETGTNLWRQYDVWPPENAIPQSFYLGSDGMLQTAATDESEAENAFDEFLSDPERPVPYLDRIAVNMAGEYMTSDQRHAARRPDVLVYQTKPLEQDTTLAGPLDVELFVSTSGTDADWVVKVIDVYPDDYPDPNPNPVGVRMGGYQQLVRGDVFRGRYRKGFEKPEPFVPNQPERIQFRLSDICHVFRPGHRLMIQVQSSWFPLFDRNPQSFVNIYQAKSADFQKATHRVFHSTAMPSRISAMVQPSVFPDGVNK